MAIFLLKDKGNNEFLMQATNFEQALKAYPKLNSVFELKSIEVLKSPVYVTDTATLKYVETMQLPNKVTTETKKKSRPTYYKKPKAVNQYDMKGNFVASYNSISEAAAVNCLGVSNISRACSGKSVHCGHFLWRYKEVV